MGLNGARPDTVLESRVRSLRVVPAAMRRSNRRPATVLLAGIWRAALGQDKTYLLTVGSLGARAMSRSEIMSKAPNTNGRKAQLKKASQSNVNIGHRQPNTAPHGPTAAIALHRQRVMQHLARHMAGIGHHPGSQYIFRSQQPLYLPRKDDARTMDGILGVHYLKHLMETMPPHRNFRLGPVTVSTTGVYVGHDYLCTLEVDHEQLRDAGKVWCASSGARPSRIRSVTSAIDFIAGWMENYGMSPLPDVARWEAARAPKEL